MKEQEYPITIVESNIAKRSGAYAKSFAKGIARRRKLLRQSETGRSRSIVSEKKVSDLFSLREAVRDRSLK